MTSDSLLGLKNQYIVHIEFIFYVLKRFFNEIKCFLCDTKSFMDVYNIGTFCLKSGTFFF